MTGNRRTVCLLAIAFLSLSTQILAQEKQQVPISRTIKISEEPRTIDPTMILPEKLATKVSVEFKEWSLQEFAQWLGEAIGMPVILDKVALEDAGISALDLVSDNAQEEPVYLLLQRVLYSLPEPLAYHINEDILHITTQNSASQIQSTETYNLTDYLTVGFEAEAIVDVIHDSTSGPWLDTDGVGGTIQILGDIMLVRSPQDLQLEVKALLKGLLKPGKQTFLLMPKEHLEFIDQLDQRASIDVVNEPLVKAVAILAEQTKLPIRLDRIALEEAGISFRKPVSLKLKNIKLGVIIEALITEEPTTWITRDGVIFITTEVVADEIHQTAIYDVRDLCRNQEEANALAVAQQAQTSGPWNNIDGVGGSLTFPKPGVLVVHQTMEVQRQILNLLTIYRKALLASKPRKKDTEDPDLVITRYYRMPAEMAGSLYELLPELVDPDSWQKENHRLYLVKSKPEIIPIASQSTSATPDKKATVTTQRALESPQAVLLIKQTKKNHELIREIIHHVEYGDGADGFDQGGGGGLLGGQQGTGGFGGGFFSLPSQ